MKLQINSNDFGRSILKSNVTLWKIAECFDISYNDTVSTIKDWIIQRNFQSDKDNVLYPETLYLEEWQLELNLIFASKYTDVSLIDFL